MKFYRIQKDDYIKLYFYSVYLSRIVTFCDKKIKKIKNLNEIKKFHPMINNKYSCHRLTYISIRFQSVLSTAISLPYLNHLNVKRKLFI